MPAQIHGQRAVYAKTPAWHRIGNVLEDCFTKDDALKVINPEHVPVEKWQAAAVNPTTGEVIITEDFCSIVQKEDGLTKVYQFPSPDYGIVQDWEQLAWMDEIVRNQDGAHYEAAVRLRGGRQTALTINLGEVVLDPQERADINYKYLFGGNSHDGSWGLMVKLANMRGECANMCAAIIRGVSPEYRTRHTSNIMERVALAQKAIGMAVEYNEVFYAQAQTLIEAKMTDNQFKRILDNVFVVDDGTREKDEEAIQTVRGIYELNPSQVRLFGTMWGGYNAVSYYNDWTTKVRGSRNTDVNEMRFLRQFDDTKGLKQKAWDIFAEAANA